MTSPEQDPLNDLGQEFEQATFRVDVSNYVGGRNQPEPSRPDQDTKVGSPAGVENFKEHMKQFAETPFARDYMQWREMTNQIIDSAIDFQDPVQPELGLRFFDNSGRNLCADFLICLAMKQHGLPVFFGRTPEDPNEDALRKHLFNGIYFDPGETGTDTEDIFSTAVLSNEAEILNGLSTGDVAYGAWAIDLFTGNMGFDQSRLAHLAGRATLTSILINIAGKAPTGSCFGEVEYSMSKVVEEYNTIVELSDGSLRPFSPEELLGMAHSAVRVAMERHKRLLKEDDDEF